MNVQNSSGNTPLHVAALNNQVCCLFTPLHVADINDYVASSVPGTRLAMFICCCTVVFWGAAAEWVEHRTHCEKAGACVLLLWFQTIGNFIP